MPATLRRLLGEMELHLHLLTPEGELPDNAVNVAVSWVHSSDLPDPTPFLSAGQILLTTGTQFPPADAADPFYDHYVARLHQHGIAGLGFGTDVIREGTPDPLIAACRARGLPLFEVPYRTPFIAIARLVADIVAEDGYARSTWALRAQRAISLAATRPDGLSATLAELSKQLGHWVALFDSGGALDRVFPAGALSDHTLAAVRGDVASLLRRGQRSSTTVSYGDETLTLQTLGGRGRLRGVLALGGTNELDQASHQVITSVIALAGMALEQTHALDRARAHLRSGLLHLLLNGETQLVENISQQMWGPLPSAPICLAITDAPADRLDAIVEYLDARAESKPSPVFYAVADDNVVLCLQARAVGLLESLVQTFGLHAGVSTALGYGQLRHAHRQAEYALADAREADQGIVRFEALLRQGILGFVARADAREIGRAILEPLIEHDSAEQTTLVESVRVWLSCNGQFESAARALGVHRHTVRARIAQAEQLLGRDLSSFHTRADIWAAIVATGDSTFPVDVVDF